MRIVVGARNDFSEVSGAQCGLDRVVSAATYSCCVCSLLRIDLLAICSIFLVHSANVELELKLTAFTMSIFQPLVGNP